MSLTTPTAPTAASPAPWLLAVVAVIIVAKSHNGSSAGRKIPLWQRHGISHHHHNCCHLRYRRSRLSFTGWLSRQQLRLHLHPALDFLLLLAGHSPIKRHAGLQDHKCPPPSNSYAQALLLYFSSPSSSMLQGSGRTPLSLVWVLNKTSCECIFTLLTCQNS